MLQFHRKGATNDRNKSHLAMKAVLNVTLKWCQLHAANVARKRFVICKRKTMTINYCSKP